MYDKRISLSSLMLQRKGICRSVSYENPLGEKGKAARTSSVLGPSRKGTPFLLNLASGETFVLADIEGSGVIRQFFITVTDQKEAGPGVLEKLILRMYWEEEEIPSVECPLGDFFCCGNNEITMCSTEPVAVVPARSFHWYFPMAFSKHAKITLENTYGSAISVVAYQVTYTLDENKAMTENISHFHSLGIKSVWNPESENELILIKGTGNSDNREFSCGLYVGIYISVRQSGRKYRKKFLLCLKDSGGNVWYEPVDGDLLKKGGWHSFRIYNPVNYEGILKISLVSWVPDTVQYTCEKESITETASNMEENNMEISGAVYWYC